MSLRGAVWLVRESDEATPSLCIGDEVASQRSPALNPLAMTWWLG